MHIISCHLGSHLISISDIQAQLHSIFRFDIDHTIFILYIFAVFSRQYHFRVKKKSQQNDEIDTPSFATSGNK